MKIQEKRKGEKRTKQGIVASVGSMTEQALQQGQQSPRQFHATLWENGGKTVKWKGQGNEDVLHGREGGDLREEVATGGVENGQRMQ